MKKKTQTSQPRIPTTDIVTILETCKNTGVAIFELGDLKVSFLPQAASRTTMTPEDPEVENQRRLLEDEDLEALELQNLMIEDPEAYEDRIRKVQHVEVRQRSERSI